MEASQLIKLLKTYPKHTPVLVNDSPNVDFNASAIFDAAKGLKKPSSWIINLQSGDQDVQKPELKISTD